MLGVVGLGRVGKAIFDGTNGMTSSTTVDPRRYHELVQEARTASASRPPICLYLEVTNRCNLLCTTCPRTYEDLEPPADLSWDLFTRIVDQVPDLARAVLHGVGEPMLVRDLPRMVKYLKERGVYVLFNTMRNSRKFGQILGSKKRSRLTLKSGRGSRTNSNTSRQIPARVIEADSARAVSVPAPRSAQLIQPGAAAAVITGSSMAWLAEIATSLSQFASFSAGDG